MTIKAYPQIIRTNKVDGMGWLVFAKTTEIIRGVQVVSEQSSFRFFTKKEAAAFISANA